MGFPFGKKKKKGASAPPAEVQVELKKPQPSSASTSGTASVSSDNPKRRSLFGKQRSLPSATNGKQQHLTSNERRSSRIRSSGSKPSTKTTPATVEPSPSPLLGSVRVRTNGSSSDQNGVNDSFELYMGDFPGNTKVQKEREIIRKQLFDSPAADEAEPSVDEDQTPERALTRQTTSNKSHEVSPEGVVQESTEDAPEAVPSTPPRANVAPFKPVTSTGKPFDESPMRPIYNMEESKQEYPKDGEIGLEKQGSFDSSSSSANDESSESYCQNDNSMERSQDQASSPGRTSRDENKGTVRTTTVATETKATATEQTINAVTQSPLARKLLAAFQCGPTSNKGAGGGGGGVGRPQQIMDWFYDTCHANSKEAARQRSRPYYNEEFAIRFLRDLMTRGVELLYLMPPNSPDNDSEDWKGRSVVMMIEPGIAGNAYDIQPKLEWSTQAGGMHYEVETTSIPLLGVHSVHTSMQGTDDDDALNKSDDDEEMCFFTITSDTGVVHIFEAISPQERDEIVNGLSNVIARLSFHLIAGDATASSELYSDASSTKSNNSNPAGDLPSLPNPHQTMNRLANAMLD